MANSEQKSCRFVLIRHGQTYWNKRKKMQGQVNIPLNETGVRQAEKLAQELKEYDFQVCFSSPLDRAYETAKVVVGDRKIPIIKDELLIEQGYTVCEGQWQPMVYHLPFFRMRHYVSHPEKYVPPIGAESMADMVARGGRVLDELLRPAAEKYDTVLVGAHGVIICAILNWLEKVPLAHFWDHVLQNCGYAVLEYAHGEWKILEKH